MHAFNPTVLPVYIIHLKERTERLNHVLEQFKNKPEFEIHIVEAIKHEIGAIGLWQSLRQCVQKGLDNNDDLIIICEDDHEFTSEYSKSFLFACIEKAKNMHADILSGGISFFRDSLQVEENLFWVQFFTGTQFTIIFKKLYQVILNASFEDDSTADRKYCELFNNNMCIHPFISIQKEFGYSDATPINNTAGLVKMLFNRSSEALQVLKDVSAFYKKITKVKEVDTTINFDSTIIPTYIINLAERTERKAHIIQQFEGKKEFEWMIVDACKHDIGALGLWLTIRKIIRLALKNDEDVIIICEDDHEFTKDYHKDTFIQNIIEANEQGADYLSGGTGGFYLAIPISKQRFWVNPCSSTQFIVIYKKFFEKILNEPFDDHVIADILLSEITSHKMVVYPFISKQKDFGYSDVTLIHNEIQGLVTNLFVESSIRLALIKKAAEYKKRLPN